jgi:membrane protein implicated in regulation of membrane protease activity
MSATLIWATLGVALVLMEVFTSTFVLLFFGVAAFLVAGLKLVGLNHLPGEICLFGGFGILGSLLLRGRIRDSLKGTATYRSDETVYLDQDIPPRGVASISYQGTPWTAVNDTDKVMLKGSKVLITRTEGVKLFLGSAD